MKKISNNSIYKNKSLAFSLVEVLVAISILLLVAVNPMRIVTNANNSTRFANEQLLAFFLAQEGLELVEKGRNDLYLKYFNNDLNNPMGRFMSNNINQNPLANCINNECGIQIANDGSLMQAVRCNNSNNNCRLYYEANNTRAKYLYGGSSPGAGQILSPYTRKIVMKPVVTTTGNLREMKVTSTVTWRTGSLIAGQKIELETYLTNIYDTD